MSRSRSRSSSSPSRSRSRGRSSMSRSPSPKARSPRSDSPAKSIKKATLEEVDSYDLPKIKEMLEKRGLSTAGVKSACKDRLMDALGL